MADDIDILTYEHFFIVVLLLPNHYLLRTSEMFLFFLLFFDGLGSCFLCSYSTSATPQNLFLFRFFSDKVSYYLLEWILHCLPGNTKWSWENSCTPYCQASLLLMWCDVTDVVLLIMCDLISGSPTNKWADGFSWHGNHLMWFPDCITMLVIECSFLWMTWLIWSPQHSLRAKQFMTITVGWGCLLWREISFHLSVRRNPVSLMTLYFSVQFSLVRCKFL
jgi:hypothetical protein